MDSERGAPKSDLGASGPSRQPQILVPHASEGLPKKDSNLPKLQYVVSAKLDKGLCPSWRMKLSHQ